jgi:hypothetical protein
MLPSKIRQIPRMNHGNTANFAAANVSMLLIADHKLVNATFRA